MTNNAHICNRDEGDPTGDTENKGNTTGETNNSETKEK
jgi:hypothetical protein